MKLHLVLKSKWYDMIVSGKKKEEYRAFTEYWEKRIWDKQKQIESVVFHRGYTSITHEREVVEFATGGGRMDWGANPNKFYFIIRLGKEVKQ